MFLASGFYPDTHLDADAALAAPGSPGSGLGSVGYDDHSEPHKSDLSSGPDSSAILLDDQRHLIEIGEQKRRQYYDDKNGTSQFHANATLL